MGDSTFAIENGSFSVKAGPIGSDDIQHIIPTVAAYENQLFKVWDDFLNRENKENFLYPIRKREICDIEAWLEIWQNFMRKKNYTDPKNASVIMVEYPMVAGEPKNNYRMRNICEYMFDYLGVNQMWIESQAVLSAFSQGKTQALIVDIGHGGTSVIPVNEGYQVTEASFKSELGGNDVTQYLMKLLEEKGFDFKTYEDHEGARGLKEANCYVAQDYDQELDSVAQESYTLPDGKEVNLSSERVKCPELLFRPSLNDLEETDLVSLIKKSIGIFNPRSQAIMYQSIMLTGGTSMFEGLEERLLKELEAGAPEDVNVDIFAPPDRKYAAWLGASLMGSMSSINDKWVTKEDYKEIGIDLVVEKCYSAM